jgi:hypothetical protein
MGYWVVVITIWMVMDGNDHYQDGDGDGGQTVTSGQGWSKVDSILDGIELESTWDGWSRMDVQSAKYRWGVLVQSGLSQQLVINYPLW